MPKEEQLYWRNLKAKKTAGQGSSTSEEDVQVLRKENEDLKREIEQMKMAPVV